VNWRHRAITATAMLVSGAFTFGVAYSIGENDRQAAEELRCRARAATIADARLGELLVEIGDIIEKSLADVEPSAEDRRQLAEANTALREANVARQRSLAACEQ
jgi:hypothetical protein